VGGSVNVVTNRTLAFVGRIAQVTAGSAGHPASVIVAAGHELSMLMVSAVAAGGTAGVGVSATVGVVDLDTDAELRQGAVVTSTADTVVAAHGRESMVAVAATASGGFVGVAGAVTVIVLDVHTHATLQRVTVDAGGSVVVDASDDTSIVVVAGGAAGGFVGVGIGVGVTSATKDTQAFVAAGAVIDADGAADPVGGILTGGFGGSAFGDFGLRPGFAGVAVQARSTQDVFGLTVALGAGAVGVAGAVTTTLLTVTTRAVVDSSASAPTRINLSSTPGAAQSVSITAANASRTLTVAGGIAAGAVGVSGGVDVGILAVSTQAYVGPSASIRVARDFSLSALASASITSFGLSVAGGAVGVAGAVSVWTFGTEAQDGYGDGNSNASALSPDGNDVRDDADATASGQGSHGYTSILQGAGSNTGSKADSHVGSAVGSANGGVAASTPGASLVGAAFSASDLPRGTSATIAADVVIVAGRDVAVRAEEANDYLGVAGAAAVGAGALGGSVAIANLRSNVDAGVSARVSITAGGNVAVAAVTTERTTGMAFAGAAGGVTLSGQFLVLNSDAVQTAHIDDAAVIPHAGGVVSADATADRRIEALGVGVGVGGVAIGAAVVITSPTGDTTARIGKVSIGAAGASGGLRVAASSTIDVPVRVYAVNAGLVGGVTAAGGVAPISGRTSATFDGTAILTGGATISATGRHTASVFMISVATGAYSAGASYATATISRDTVATLTANAIITAPGAVAVRANTRNAAQVSTNGGNLSGMASPS